VDAASLRSDYSPRDDDLIRFNVWRLFNNAQLRQQMSGTVLRVAQASEISQVRVADLIDHLTRHFCFVTLVFGRS
jgi:hypothetical protein